ncbi:hypothetical protein Aph01nite_43200 [Acrocarpospora phusangensis]|uniref:Uncharacterized protein n=1 Tax=Acrocarpospora phusangensis TaxID=1070424 RepID=A0A919QEQ1_9ACTN|nr:hypothetical protein [Acrocarpospora phusangensis]GIH26010.1 hypothetical protein Aph01nite_43200 [Acrocarpospora phusangensis]
MNLNTPVRHGYTLDDLDRFARSAVSREITRGSWRGTQIGERYEIAWSAIAWHVSAAEEAPTASELAVVGMRALNDTLSQHRKHHGTRDNARAFAAYWLDLGAPSGSPEGATVEALALAQIWPRLTPREKDVLVALATYDDHRAAAAVVGLSTRAFACQLSLARKRFLALWHEGEIPSRPWGNDRRRKAGARHQAMATRLRARPSRKAGRSGSPSPLPREAA